MKVLIAGLLVAASVAVVSAPVSAAPVRSDATQVSSFQTVAYHGRHHRHKVCVMRRHHRVCSWR